MNEPKQDLKAICPEPQNFSEAGLAAVRELATLECTPMNGEELVRRIPEFDLLLVRLQTKVTRELLAAGSRLRAVLSPTTGLNHIDLTAAAERNVEVFHLKGHADFLRSVPSTAEHTWALLLALVRNVPSAFDAVKEGRWEQEAFRGHELHDKRLGVLGCGRLGAMVAHYGRAFGMRVAAYDPYTSLIPSYVERCQSLDELLVQSDILSIHVPYDDETEGMIGADELRKLPRNAVVINTSRGEIVDEDALVDLLESGHLAGAAVDVLRNELDPDKRDGRLVSYARRCDNLIVTPHIGGATFEAVEKTDLFVVLRLSEWLAEKVS